MALLLAQNITANGSTTEVNITNPNNGANIFQNVGVSGDFDGGTAAVEISNDGGTSFFAATDSIGPIALVASGMVTTFVLGPTKNIAVNQIKMRVTLSGATSPDINITITDVK